MIRVLMLSALLIALITAAIWIGHQQPAPEVLAPAADCDLPCWLGITPGVDPMSRANWILLGAGYYAERWAQDRERIRYDAPDHAAACDVRLELDEFTIIELLLTDCPDLRLGDVISVLGPPEGVLPAAASFSFAGGTVSVGLEIDSCLPEMRPDTPVRYIRMTPESSAARSQTPWRGFLPAWRYQQLTPDIVALGC